MSHAEPEGVTASPNKNRLPTVLFDSPGTTSPIMEAYGLFKRAYKKARVCYKWISNIFYRH